MQAVTTLERGRIAPASLNARRRADVPALTGLRFIAAFAVLLAHGLSTTVVDNDLPEGAIYWLMTASGFGMTLFFVLSGFVIHYNYATLVTEGRLRGIGAFLWARFARLYPLFLLMMLLYVLVSNRTFALVTGHPERFGSILQALPYFLLSIQSWVYTVIDGDSLINAVRGGSPPTWSISTEWFFYFAYPCIAWLVLRARQPSIILLGAGLWCLLWIALSTGLYDRAPQISAWGVAHFGAIAGMQDQENSFVRWLLYLSPYLRIGEFVLGVFAAHLYVALRNRKVTSWENAAGSVVFLVAAASIILIDYLEYGPDAPLTIFRKMSMNFALAPSVALLIFCTARYHNAASRLLTSRPAIALGDASYSIYLVHSIVFISAVRLSAGAAHGMAYNLVRLIVLMAVVVVVSMALYTYYEAPARKWLRQRWSKRPSLGA